MRVFAAVVTQKFPFYRLIGALDAFEAQEGADVFVQYGYSTRPALCEGRAFLSKEEYLSQLARADVAVVHGGVGTIRSALACGTRVVAVPRERARGEHVDDHQREIVLAFSEAGLLIPCLDTCSLGESVRRAATAEKPTFDPGPCLIEEDIVQLMARDGFGAVLSLGERGCVE